MAGAVHSIHFPAPEIPAARFEQAAARSATHGRKSRSARKPAHEVNMIECFSGALRDAEITREKLRELVTTSNRHGDLLVALTATRRLQAALETLIGAEEVS